MQNSNPKLFAILIAFLACAIWAGNFAIARGFNDSVPPIAMAFWRWVVAFFFLLPFTYKAHYTTTHHIALISSTAPIGILLIAGILGFDKFTKNKVIGAISALIGALIVISHGKVLYIFELSWNKGDLILLLTASIWASWGAALHFKPKAMSSRVFLLSQMFFGVLAIFPFFIWEHYNVAQVDHNVKSWIVFLYIGIGASVVAWLAWQKSVEIIGAVKTGIVYYSIPVFSSLLAVIFLSEPLKLYHFIGFIFIFLGILISNKEKIIQSSST